MKRLSSLFRSKKPGSGPSAPVDEAQLADLEAGRVGVVEGLGWYPGTHPLEHTGTHPWARLIEHSSMALFAYPEGSLCLHTIKSISYKAFEVFGLDLALDEVVGGTRLHRFDVHMVTAATGQHDHRRPKLVSGGFPE